jgi:hypothetical protein
MGAGHADQIGVTGADGLIGFLQRAEPARDDGRHADRAGDGHGLGQFIARRFMHPADHLGEGVIAAEADVDEVDQAFRFQHLRRPRVLLRADPASAAVRRQPDAKREVLRHRRPAGAHHFAHETHPVLERTAIVVIAFVEVG